MATTAHKLPRLQVPDRDGDASTQQAWHGTDPTGRGLGQWKEEHVLRKFYQYREYVEKGSPEITAEDFTLMPWLNSCQLPPEDLGANYAYLRTVQPIYNAVVKHPDPEVKPESTIARSLADALGRRAKRS